MFSSESKGNSRLYSLRFNKRSLIHEKNNTLIPFNCFHWAMEVFIIKTNIINHYFLSCFQNILLV